MTTLPKHDRYPINMINITVSTKCQQIKTYAHIREKNKTYRHHKLKGISVHPYG